MATVYNNIALDYSLSIDEAIILVITELWMIKQDVARERNHQQTASKRHTQNQHRAAFTTAMKPQGDLTGKVDWDLLTLHGEDWTTRFASSFNADGVFRFKHVESLALVAAVCANVERRQRALLLLTELYAFHPWEDGIRWNNRARMDTLREIVGFMAGVTQADLENIDREFKQSLKKLARTNIRWGRVAALTVFGLGLGVLTAGLAAPIIGGVVGGFMGFSGAAATSAGLAALGGGSLAAGGLGMAGGTALIAGLGGVAAGGAAAGLSGVTTGQILFETVKLEVLTQLIIIDEEGDDAKARIIIEGMSERIRQVEEEFKCFAEEIVKLRGQNEHLRKELQAKMDELSLAKTKLMQAIEHLAPQTGSPLGALNG